MKVDFSTIKHNLGLLITVGTLSYATPVQSQQVKLTQEPDTFVRVSVNPVDKYTSADLPEVFREPVNPSSWTNDPEILKTAPDPYFKLKGKKTLAKGVIDITNCRLYIYDKAGKAIESYRVAVGAPKTPSPTGIRKILKKQVYPYKDCSPSTKRARFPYDYGPNIAYLNSVDTITGGMKDDGRYFHGTRHEKDVVAVERHVTHGCARVHNRDAKYLILDVFKIGDFLKYIKRAKIK